MAKGRGAAGGGRAADRRHGVPPAAGHPATLSRRPPARLILLFLLLLFGPARAGDAPFSRDEVQLVLAVALGVVLERHLEAASPAELALWSLRGLEVLEPGLKPELRAGTLLLSRADRLVASRPVPQPPPGTASDAAAVPLAVTLAALFDVAWRSSPALRRAGQDGMLRSAFEELFNHLDPYSRYVSPAEAVATRTRRVGQAGLGLRLAAGRGRRVVVAALLPEGPAAQAGLRPGDQVLAVDGIGVSVDDLAAAATLLEGPAGTAVTLRLQRGGRRFDALLHRIPGCQSRCRRSGGRMRCGFGWTPSPPSPRRG
ncbi:S41 family peptidase [Siccirubricoccus deserti]